MGCRQPGRGAGEGSRSSEPQSQGPRARRQCTRELGAQAQESPAQPWCPRARPGVPKDAEEEEELDPHPQSTKAVPGPGTPRCTYRPGPTASPRLPGASAAFPAPKVKVGCATWGTMGTGKGERAELGRPRRLGRGVPDRANEGDTAQRAAPRL